MVERQLRRRGIDDERVLAAMAAVPREEFVAGDLRGHAYDDSALPIGHGQTVSQPWVVAAICQALELKGDERVLEIGTGSGYSAAVLARLAQTVISVERVGELAAQAAATLARLGVGGVRVVEGDGSAGLEGHEPFQAIAIHAATPAVPPALAAQLAPGGRLVAPIAERGADVLTVFRRGDDGEGEPELEPRRIAPCRFVPLVGEGGFPEG